MRFVSIIHIHHNIKRFSLTKITPRENRTVTLCVDPADQSWRPLMLIVPLRLGLTAVNPIYIDALKRCFQLPGNVGMIGGRPNQALYFIGYVGDEALYLDPHTTQATASVGAKTAADELEADATFHQRYAGRIDFRAMDPSLALAFLCRTRDEFDTLCEALRADGAGDGQQQLFEVAQTGYRPWVSQTHSDECAKRRASGLQEGEWGFFWGNMGGTGSYDCF